MGKSVHYRTHGNECTRNLVKFAGNQLVMISFFKICRFFDSSFCLLWLSNPSERVMNKNPIKELRVCVTCARTRKQLLICIDEYVAS